MRWDIVIMPFMQGELKLQDPQLQANAMMAKMLIKGQTLGRVPWKTLIRFKLHGTQLSHMGRWHRSNQ